MKMSVRTGTKTVLSRKRGRAETRKEAGPVGLAGWCGKLAGAVGLVVAVTGGAGSLRALEITLPQETAKLIASPLPGYEMAQMMCLTCHSADYMKMQPVSSRAYWQGSVTKMQKTFGAPIPAEAVEPLVDYLTKTYGNERPAAPEKRVEPVKAGPGQPATK